MSDKKKPEKGKVIPIKKNEKKAKPREPRPHKGGQSLPGHVRDD